jgi:signal transduction histidine kinase
MNPVAESSPPDSQPSLRKALLLTFCFGALGYFGNLVRLPLGFNLAFIFGSVFTLLCTALLGWRWGLVSTVLASIYTYFLWNHPFAIAILAAETLWLAIALRRGHRNLLLIVTPFWILVGIPLVFLFYGGIQHLDLQTTLATALKQAINGLFNALIAGVLMRYIPLQKWLGLGTSSGRYPLSTVIFDISMVLLLVPSVAAIIIVIRREIRLSEQRVVSEITTEAAYRNAVLRSWVDRQTLAVTAVAALGPRLRTTPAPHLQEDLRQIHLLTPDFLNMFLLDANGRSVLFDPLMNEHGQSSIQLDFSDHPYFQQVKATLKPLISEVFVGSRAAFRPLFTMSVPWLEAGRFKGLASGAVNLASLNMVLTQAQGANPPLLALLDSHNDLVAASGPGQHTLSRMADPPGTHVQKISDRVSLHIPSTQKNISIMDTWKQAHYLTEVAVEGTPWTLVVSRSAGPLQARTLSLVVWSLAGLGGTFLLVILVASLVARSLSSASIQLAAFAKDLSHRVEGGEDLVWPETRFEEVSQMTSHFRSTSKALGERIHQLKLETERRTESERMMTHQARMAAMGEMIGNIAHQWRQPLNSLSMLLANIRDASRQRELDHERLELSFLKGEALIQKMSSTISDFMNFFRPNKEPSSFSCLQQIQAVLGLVEASFKAGSIDIQIEAPNDVRLFGFPNEYSQVLLNLLSNAKQAIEGNRATVRHIRICLSEEAGMGRLTVGDTGGGIPEGILDRVFEPYFSTKETGTGIGLYMSQQIIERSMGGQITAKNIEGGAEFAVLVPVAGEGK